MHFRILPDHQNQVLKKDIFQRFECLKTFFDAFSDHQNQVLKKLFLTSAGGLEMHQNTFLTTQNVEKYLF
jgi:hypothetical protein